MILNLTAQASNIKRENERYYGIGEFVELYPQFVELIPDAALVSFVELGNKCISDKRYGDMWKHAIGLFIAHFCTLYLQSAQEADSPATKVLDTARAAGVVTSEIADGVSYSMDLSALNDLNGWAAFKLTAFGAQFATIAKLVGKGGIYVW